MAVKGLDTMTAEEEAQFKEMKQADADFSPANVRSTEQVQDGAQEPEERAAPEQDAPEPEEQEVVTEPEAETKERTPQQVDKRALDAERERRRKAEAKAAELDVKHAAELAKAQERLNLLQQAAQEHLQAQQVQQQAQRAPEPPAPPPDFDTDPAGFIKHNFQLLQQRDEARERELAQVRSWTQQQQQAWQQQQQREALAAWGYAQEEQFRAQQPDYGDAIAHLAAARERLARVTNPNATPAQIREQVTRETLDTAAMAQQRGMNFGQMLYAIAEAHGYQKGARQQQAPITIDAASSPAPAIPAPSAAPPANAAERLIRGQEMATTIGSTGGAPKGDLTINAITKMSDAEFAKHYEATRKNGIEAMKNLFGA